MIKLVRHPLQQRLPQSLLGEGFRYEIIHSAPVALIHVLLAEEGAHSHYRNVLHFLFYIELSDLSSCLQPIQDWHVVIHKHDQVPEAPIACEFLIPQSLNCGLTIAYPCHLEA